MTITTSESYDKMYALMDKQKTDSFEWAEWIARERKKRGWSQSKLADLVGTKRQTINDYELFRRPNPSSEILSKVSEILGEADDFLPRLAGLLPPNKETEDPWVKKMTAKLLRVPSQNRDAADKMIESLAEKEIEPRQIKHKSKTVTR